MTDPYQIMERGANAGALLESPTFVSAMNDLSGSHLAALLACRPIPSEAEARDYHHRMLHALDEIHATLMGYVTAGMEAKESLEALDDEVIEVTE